MKEIHTPAQLFLSYAEEDDAYCDLLKKHLSESVRQQTLTLWSRYQIEAGSNVEEEIATHLEQASLILLLFSPDYLANDTCHHQLQQAIQIGEQEPERVYIVLLRPCAWREIWTNIVHKEHFHFLPYSGRAISHWSIPDRDDVTQDIVGELTKQVERAQRTKLPGQSATIPITPFTPPKKLSNPYLALRSFGIEDEPSFHGREGQTKEILAKVEDMLRTRNTGKGQRLLAVIGASGAGKSSLLHAGVLPHLIRGELAGSEAWIILRTLYPGDQPLDNLVDVLYDHLPAEEKREDIKGTLAGSASGLGYIINQIVRHAQPHRTGSISTNTPVVLVIDQFEECLTQNNRAECKKFIQLLFTATTRRDVPLLILMACRADFYQELMGYDDFFELLRQHEVILNKAMTFSEMRAAIETPLHKLDSALQFETDLVDQIIADLQGQKEALPLLQFTLFELFEHRQDFLLTRQAYQEIHGVHGTLATHAEKIYANFPKQQTAIHTLFLSLVKVSMGDDQEFIAARQSIDYAQLLQLDEAARVPMRKMIDAFIDARLLTANRQKNQRMLEISHEILLQAWPRLAGWIRENGEALYKTNRATQDARNWQRNKQLSKDLYAGQQLQELKNLAQQDFIGNDEPLRTFLHKSQTRQNRLYVTRISTIVALLLVVSSTIYTIFLNYMLVPQAQIQVTNAQDNGSGSLRDALQRARPGDTIVLDSSTIGQAPIMLQTDLNFAANDDNVTLQGNGVVLTASAGQQLHIFPGIIITFNNLSIQNSRSAPNRASGGVIFNQGLLTLISCNISNNQSNYNGGALVNTDNLTIENTTFSNNTSPGYGGAIYNDKGYVNINNKSDIKSNRARDGGGLYSMKGTVIIIDSTVENNQAGKADGSRYFGGGLALRDATLTMTSSTVRNNTIYGDGGGISLLDTVATLNTSTIIKNTANITSTSDTPSWGGGGIAVDISTANNSSTPTQIVKGVVIDNTIQPSNSSNNPFLNVLGKKQNLGNNLFIVTNQTPVPIGYPPSAQAPENLNNNYANNININLFCQTNGYSQGDPTPDDVTFITCISPLTTTQKMPQTQSYPAVAVCKDQLNGSAQNVASRLYDYYDPSTWECYKDVKPVASFTKDNMEDLLDNFCKQKYQGVEKNLPRKTAYDWQCENADGMLTGISMADACRFVTHNLNAFESLASFTNPYGWKCWVPL